MMTSDKDKSPVKKKATIVDISKKTGYSIATVSRALNNFSNVKETTKKKILEVSKDINYVPNIAAQNLVKGKSKLIGLILPDNSSIYNTFPQFFTKAMEIEGYRVVTYESNNEASRQEFNIEQLLRQQVDGMAICPVPGEYDVVERLGDVKIPFVIFNRFIKDFPVSHVVFNFRHDH